MPLFSKHVADFIDSHRVARLATAGPSADPHVIPICYAFDGAAIYSVIDEKPKTTPNLKRLRNIRENPRAALLIDDYSEDWSRLSYVLIHATVEVLSSGEEHARAIALLRRKYPQYEAMRLEGSPVLKLVPERVVSWSAGQPANPESPQSENSIGGQPPTDAIT